MSEPIETVADSELLEYNYTRTPNEIFDLKLPCQEKMVWITLLKFCTWGTFEGARPSIKTVAEEAGMSVSEVRRAISVLAQWGLVTVTRRISKDGGQTSNAYRLHHPNAARTPVSLNEGGVQEEQPPAVTVNNDPDPILTQIPGPISPEPAAPEPTVADSLAKARERDRRRREAWSRMHAAQEPDEEPTGWQAPGSPEQHEFLEATGARRFETGQKRQVELIEALMDTAMVMGEQAWTTLESYLARAPAGAGLDLARLPCLPQLWWDDRLEQARSHRWSRKGLLKALLNREKLMEFVRRQVRQMQKGGRETYDRRTDTGDPDLGIDDPSALVP